MEYEYSCGAVLFARMKGEIYYVLVIAPNAVCGLPKGHIEAGETERETALREIYEETGVTPRLIDGFCERIEYPMPSKSGKPDIKKRVTYFLAEYDEQPLTVPARELAGVCRFPFERAIQYITHPDLKRVLEHADAFVRERL